MSTVHEVPHRLNDAKAAIARSQPSVSKQLETSHDVLCGSEVYGRIAHWLQKKYFSVDVLVYSAD